MGDFGSATEAVQIIDLFALQVFAKNLDRCNFRVLQHNLPKLDLEAALTENCRPLPSLRLSIAPQGSC